MKKHLKAILFSFVVTSTMGGIIYLNLYYPVFGLILATVLFAIGLYAAAYSVFKN
jgi:hypothetical protein